MPPKCRDVSSLLREGVSVRSLQLSSGMGTWLQKSSSCSSSEGIPRNVSSLRADMEIAQFMPVISAFRQLRQENCCKLDVYVGYRIKPCLKNPKWKIKE